MSALKRTPNRALDEGAVEEAKQNLAGLIQAGLTSAKLEVDALSAQTKIPRSTIMALLGEPPTGVLPERVYMRGHLSVLAKELGIDEPEVLANFDKAYPKALKDTASDSSGSLPARTLILMVCLGGLALLAVVFAFMSALS